MTYRSIKQLRLPLELEFNVSADDPVRLLDTFVEEMDLSDLHSTMRKKLYKIKLEASISFVHGIGKRKTDLQKSIELTEQYISKLQEYVSKLHKCGSRNIVADAGYESEENYRFIELNNQVAYIKPNNYEISKTRKYKKDIGRR